MAIVSVGIYMMPPASKWLFRAGDAKISVGEFQAFPKRPEIISTWYVWMVFEMKETKRN
jgi:hypothetical protein